MKGLILYCKRFSYTDTQKSSRPKGIHSPEFEESRFKDSLVVLSCIEKGDNEGYVKMAVSRVDSLNKELLHSNQIILMPFVHLSNKIEKWKRAMELLEQFAKGLDSLGYGVEVCTFGTHKRALFDINGFPGTVSYFEFPYEEVSN